MKEQEKKTPSDSLTAATSPNGGGKARYLLHYCADCRRRLEGLGYTFTDSARAPVWRSCGLCGALLLITPAEMHAPVRRYRKRTGAGERARAGRTTR